MSRYCRACNKIDIPWERSQIFHKFPKEIELREKWTSFCGKLVVPTSAYICSDHFEPSCYKETDGFTGKKLLIKGSIPSIMTATTTSEATTTEESLGSSLEQEVFPNEPVSHITENECSLNRSASVSCNEGPNFKRKISTDQETISKKIRIKDGFQYLELTREDFANEEKYQKCLRMFKCKNRIIDNLQRVRARNNEKTLQLVQRLRENNEAAAANFLKNSRDDSQETRQENQFQEVSVTREESQFQEVCVTREDEHEENHVIVQALLKQEDDLGCLVDDADGYLEDTNSNAENTSYHHTATQHNETETVKIERPSDSRREDDEFDLFGKSIALQLRNMPLERALICQETLQAVMRQERLYQLHHLP